MTRHWWAGPLGAGVLSVATIVWPGPSEPLPRSPELCQWFRVVQPWHNISRDINREWGEFTEVYREKWRNITPVCEELTTWLRLSKCCQLALLLLVETILGTNCFWCREFYFVFTIGLAFIIFEIYSKLETRKTDVWMHFIDKKNDLKHCGTTLQSLLSKSNYVFNSNEAFNRVVKTIGE